jgi:hypothetical protein
MTTLPTDIELDPSIYGTVVNNEPTPALDEYDNKIEELLAPISCKLSLTGSENARLQRLCADQGLTVGELCEKLLRDEIGTRVSAPFIAGPSWSKGTVKVTGPTGSVTRG